MAPLLFGLLPAIEEIKISPPLAKAVREKTDTDVPSAMYKYAEPTLNFYIGRKIETLRNDEAVAAWAKQPIPGALIIPKDVLWVSSSGLVLCLWSKSPRKTVLTIQKENSSKFWL